MFGACHTIPSVRVGLIGGLLDGLDNMACAFISTTRLCHTIIRSVKLRAWWILTKEASDVHGATDYTMYKGVAGVDEIQTQLTDHEQRIIHLEDWTQAAKDQMKDQRSQSAAITDRIDGLMDQLSRLYKSVIIAGTSIMVALIGVIVTLMVH